MNTQTKAGVQLNLARKWRSRTFDEVVGQELSLKMLKNSLYKDHYFPVYLFSGQRGCGKTTTARIFAAAINCEKLSEFQKNPKEQIVPCLKCTSCVALRAGKHPDFIEMDAASHTGVDNVRQIVDAASLLPLMGRKKVYLIDEAHMLSKAAFNAFLKILEEPPASVLFILATTDPEKIIETVRSRCFQLFFRPIEMAPLLKHLAYICKEEEIAYDIAALKLIIAQTDGSARDALNVLEQVRFASGRVTKESVQSVLGHVDDACLIELFNAVLHKSPKFLLQFLQKKSLNTYDAGFIWHTLTSCVRAALWLKHGVAPQQFIEHHETLKKIVASTSWKQINNLLDQLYGNEHLFLKTTDQYGVLEMILLQACQKNKKNNNSGSGPASSAQISPSSTEEWVDEEFEEDEDEDDDRIDELEEELKPFQGHVSDSVKTTRDTQSDGEKAVLVKKEKVQASSPWELFLQQLEQKNDPLALSIFKQAVFTAFDKVSAKLTITFPKQFIFFKELLEQTSAIWQPLANNCFGVTIVLDSVFNGVAAKPIEVKRTEQKQEKVTPVSMPMPVPRPAQQKAKRAYSGGNSYRPFGSRGNQRMPKMYLGKSPVATSAIDVSDNVKWPQAHLLQKHFSGGIKEITKA